MPRRQPLRFVELWDGRRELGRVEDGLPTFDFGQAPAGLATRRQLRAAGLCPGGHDVVAQLKWRRGKAWAGLYRVDLAQPKRTPTLAQRHALRAAMAARRRCVRCGRDAGFCLPRNTKTCWPCDQQTSGYDLAA